MAKSSKERTAIRQEEIVDACSTLYETMSFKDISIGDIGAKTTFTRTSIYNYFQTKEEIFLALPQREYETWCIDLQAIQEKDRLSPEAFSQELAHSLEKRIHMLKLMSMNLYDIESNSRLEKLVLFKKAYAHAFSTLDSCLIKFFPFMDPDDRQEFLYAFFPFLFGVYPYTTATDKQKEAMALARFSYAQYSVVDLISSFTLRQLVAFQQKSVLDS